MDFDISTSIKCKYQNNSENTSIKY